MEKLRVEDIKDLVSSKYFFEEDDRTDSSTLVLRLNIYTEENAEVLINEITSSTNTDYVVYNHRRNTKMLTYRKSLKCHHSNYRKKASSCKMTHCQSTIEVKIKVITAWTQRVDKFLRMTPPLSCEVIIKLEHNHALNSAGALKMLSVREGVKEQYFSYFSNGLSPSQAASIHENDLLCQSKYEELANSSINPNLSQVYYLYKVWREANFGLCQNSFEKLEERISFYNEKGATVEYLNGTSWAILVSTQVMKRCHNLKSAQEMVFVDSSCSCEQTSSTVTILLTATKAGAVPIAVLIHKDQTIENYTKAFGLLKKHFPLCFGGLNAPAIFMTDDSRAEKSALADLWPESRQLLCHFHVAQAEWRWIFGQRDIPQQERPRLMKLFQAVMYSINEVKLNEAVVELQKERLTYPSFVARFEQYISRRTEWLLLDRDGILTRGNNTNNFAEATVRILKDIVLCRTKAYNVVALVEFCMSIWEDYLKQRLLSYAYGREAKPILLYKSLLKKTCVYKIEDVIQIEESLYLMKDSKNEDIYLDSELGVCSCMSGRFGAFCPHQCFLYSKFDVQMPNMPLICHDDRYIFGRLALGEACPDKSFFRDLQEENGHSQVVESSPQNVTQPMDAFDDKAEASKLLIKLKEELERAANIIPAEWSGDINKLKNAVTQLKKIDAFDDILKITCLKSLNRKKRTIHAQPTSISRRRPGLTKGCRRVPAGRPCKLIKSNSTKRKRTLSANIKQNIANAR